MGFFDWKLALVYPPCKFTNEGCKHKDKMRLSPKITTIYD